MSPYLAGGMLLAFIAWSGFMYHEGASKETAVCGQADAKHDLAQAGVTVAAEKGVIATVAEQQTVTQGVDNAYQAKDHDIDNQYITGFVGVQHSTLPGTIPDICAAGNTAGRPHAAASRPFVTTVYKITPKECDQNTNKLYGLQAWVKGQQKVKQPAE